MANRDNPSGFHPLRTINGSGDIPTMEFVVTTGATIYKGDLVTAEAAGTIVASTANDGVSVLGVAAEYVDDSASAGGKKINVWLAKDVIFKVQADSGTALTSAAIFATANHVATTGNTTTKISNHELDSSDVGTGLQLRILGLHNAPDNTWAEHADVEVIIQENCLTDTTSI